MTAVLLASIAGCALGWGADWLTDGGNSQRTAWQKDEKIFNPESVKGMKLLWKLQLDNEPRQMHSLFPPLIVERVNTRSGLRQIAIEAGVSDNIYAIDVEKGEVIWKKHFESNCTPPAERRPGRRHSVSRRADRDPGDRAHGHARASTPFTPLPGTACSIS